MSGSGTTVGSVFRVSAKATDTSLLGKVSEPVIVKAVAAYMTPAEEIEAHLAAQTEENIRAGMTPEEAARQARLKFGSMEAVRADYHAEATLPLLEDLLRDGRYALRVLWRSPAFTLVAVLSLMFGIGANVVVFGVVNAVLLRPLAVSDPPSLYQDRQQAWAKGRLLTTSYPAWRDFQPHSPGNHLFVFSRRCPPVRERSGNSRLWLVKRLSASGVQRPGR